jgi:hypothetical protein
MDRKSLIQHIEDIRSSRVITYMTSDRQGPVNARIAMDIIPVISKQLRAIGKTDRIDLFIYSSGGDTMVPWRLVSMIREYCRTFSVLIPYKAHSAATMIALGADEIVMSDLSELTPIDPSTVNVFNPQDPKSAHNKIPISVEDVIAYFDLAKNKFGIKDDRELANIFNKFVEANPQIHPLALGNVNRIHNLIRMLAKRLLNLAAADALRPFAPNAVTDVTGFGLLGHAYEMAERSGVRLVRAGGPPPAQPAPPAAPPPRSAAAPRCPWIRYITY